MIVEKLFHKYTQSDESRIGDIYIKKMYYLDITHEQTIAITIYEMLICELNSKEKQFEKVHALKLDKVI